MRQLGGPFSRRGQIRRWGPLARGSARRAPTSARWVDRRKAARSARDPRGRSVLKPVLCLRGRKPKLQALYSTQLSDRRAPSIGRHAAWRHAGCRRLRRRDPHECFGRGAPDLSSPIRASPKRKSISVLEFVEAEIKFGAPANLPSLPGSPAKFLRIRHRSARVFVAGLPPEAPWRRDGSDLSRGLRGRRRPFRSALPVGHRRSPRLRRCGEIRVYQAADRKRGLRQITPFARGPSSSTATRITSSIRRMPQNRRGAHQGR